ncbi:site-2 protease family protein [Desulfovibrio litoralis]|uniref:Putative peptide zinc metalloprotease protein n=1 Tax=Desulfovibrio litoralis DSM 11393 TaxID=1121455 RepID=A0A1M7SSF8_9BACT|nr:site-2 protease family protein [Desulfovibrio litoralis]SHN61422.1 putative peptide zinc metalloprotease protein [Desulfovibrio litoralis DSM 11393]
MAGAIEPQTVPQWLPLRNELRINQGPPSKHGAPSWTLHDPSAHRFFRLGWLEFEVLSRWQYGTTQEILQSIIQETTMQPSLEQVQAVYDFALRNQLVQTSSQEDSERLVSIKQLSMTSIGHKILHGYLFMRIPLLAPDHWLEKSLPYIRWVFTRRFLFGLVLLMFFSLYLVSREWTVFLTQLTNLWSWQQSLMIIAALGLAKSVHELGHAFAAKHLGLKVPRMGLALMCFTPVLWTDVTEAWKLPNKKDRLLVDTAGIWAELTLATLAALLWPLFPQGAFKSSLLTLSGVTWLATITVNANPFMRYDGYYILSDLWDIPGLQQRSFALARWHLREWLFGFGEPVPEALTPGQRTQLILYAYGTWFYRFFLFMGIALLVYHMFFKALGLALMLVELIWFIALPIYKEFRYWYSKRTNIKLNLKSLRSITLTLGLILIFIVPWNTRVKGSGILAPEHIATLYIQQPGILLEKLVDSGDQVEKDKILLRFTSPNLDKQIALMRQKVETLRLSLATSSLDSELRTSYTIDLQEMQATTSELNGLLQAQERLTLLSPLNGTLHDLPLWLQKGVWVPENTQLGLVASKKSQVTAYIAEEDLGRLQLGASGIFYPISGYFPPIPLKVISIETAAVRDIIHKELPSTTIGGIIPARQGADKRIVPEQALYKVVCSVETTNSLPPHSLSGTVSLKGLRQSLAVRLWQAGVGIIIRESGFD